MRKQTTAALCCTHIHLAKFRAGHVWNAVKAGEPLIQEGVIRIEKIQHAAVFANDIAKEKFSFLAHGLAERFVEFRKPFGIGLHNIDVFQLQPLTAKIFH